MGDCSAAGVRRASKSTSGIPQAGRDLLGTSVYARLCVSAYMCVHAYVCVFVCACLSVRQKETDCHSDV